MSRSKVNNIREQVSLQLSDNALAYKRKLLRELDALWKQSGSYGAADAEERFNILAEKVANEFKITGAAKDLFIAEVKSGQKQIADVWKEYFMDIPLTDGRVISFEKMRALYTIDFKQLQVEQKDIISEEIGKVIKSGDGIGVLRDSLKKRGMGAAQAETLANTSLAQFDNGIMHEYAAQAGIDKFRYDGPDNPTSRPFCKERVGKIFTLDEILKMNNGQGLDVLTSCGGFRCVHSWSPIVEGL